VAAIAALVLLDAGAGRAQVPAAPEAEVEPEPADLRAMSHSLGREPVDCAQVSADLEICTWYSPSSVKVCQFDGQKRRTLEPCLEGSTRPQPKRPPASADAKAKQAFFDKRRQEAVDRLAGAKDIGEVIDLVGAGPAWCETGERLTCAWIVLRRAPGYRELARFTETRGGKIGLRCHFAPTPGYARQSCETRLANSADELREPRPEAASE